MSSPATERFDLRRTERHNTSAEAERSARAAGRGARYTCLM